MTEDTIEEIRLWDNVVEELMKRGYTLEAISEIRKWYMP